MPVEYLIGFVFGALAGALVMAIFCALITTNGKR